MKFIHTADWHLGKLVHGIYMTEDQKLVLQELITIIKDEKPDALIIAGDLYDRSVPPTEAVNLLNDTLYKINVELNVPVIAVSGNHDSAERLSFGSSWYKKSNLYMTGKWQPDSDFIEIKGVRFYAVPFCEPGPIRELLNNTAITSHHAAMKAIVDHIAEGIDPTVPSVLIGHAFVLGGKTTDSERTLSVGGTGCVGSELFSPFSYTALGHLHNPDAIKHEKIHYSGSLMKYSFSEAKQRKVIKIVEVHENGEVNVAEKPLSAKKDMRELNGYLEELLDPAFYTKQKCDDYLKITLLDEGALIDPMSQLRQVYPNVLHLEKKTAIRDQKNRNSAQLSKSKGMTDIDLFKDFYSQLTTTDWSLEKEKKIMSIMSNAGGREEQG
ncbi:exonuclease SbcCD subunit D [Jeotgalibacillus proteolyticus]|uniref:Nuclease SbcCD subunit D n=1 Tax=Jeotgalibacillus proteolyticus TaxID=2082395 RepID=A0A2S5GGB1_9BACL|nr:exonuclease SbcCD subunit D [Jeotgalibacillus proteolyticus]PPA71955.1 exonuclease sbcCD subunit D [Jeotgalibacillus proteolyticus]